MIKRSLLPLLIVILFAGIAPAQKAGKFSYLAQKKLIPTELGQVYLGMPFKQFAAKINLKDAEADTRFEPLELTVPFKKGNIRALSIRIHGLSADEKTAIVRKGKAKFKNLLGEDDEREADLLDITKIPSKGFVYAIYIMYNDDFDLKSYVTKMYGKPGDVYKKGDNGYFYDYQWTKKTADGLVWLIRSYFVEKGARSIQLLGRIDGTEWDPGV